MLVAEASWDLVHAFLTRGAVALLPVGAASKEHGRHLPMNADWLLAEALARRVAASKPVAVWPTLNYGHYPAFTDYPGSISLTSATFEAVVAEIAGGIFSSGAGALLLVNTGISTIAPFEAVRDKLSAGPRLAIAHVWQGSRYRQVAARVQREPRGGHAGELETSILMALAPQQVDLRRARPWVPETLATPGALSRTDAANPRYSPDGIFGDPRSATAETGAQLLAAMQADVEAMIAALT